MKIPQSKSELFGVKKLCSNTFTALFLHLDEQVTTELDVILGIEDDPATVTPEEINDVVEEALLVMTNNTAVTAPLQAQIEVKIEM